MNIRIASGFAPFSPCMDRFNTSGYREPLELEDQFREAAKIKGLSGVGLDYPYQFTDCKKIRELLDRYDLKIATVEVGLYPDKKWKNGTFTSSDSKIRREAIDMCKKALDVSDDLGAEDVLIWPGQDGFDYPFQIDYDRAWNYLIEGIREVAEYRPDVKISIEYKKQEPRTNCFIRNVGVLLNLLSTLNMKNVGGCIDLGHSLAAGENPAEAAVLLYRAGKLFQVHLNDNYRDWDHDLIMGSVTFWETLEFFYWLNRCGWNGWYILDIFPYRIDGSNALQEGVNRARFFIELAERIDSHKLRESLSKNDVLSSAGLLWREVLGYGD